MESFRNVVMLSAVSFLLLISTMYGQGGTSYIWTPTSNISNWADSINWNPTGVPASNDAALLNVNNFTVIVDDRTVSELKLINGIMEGQTLAVADTFNWSGGRLDESITIIVSNTSQCKISGTAVKHLDGSAQLITKGKTFWEGGKIDFDGGGAQPLWINRGELHIVSEQTGGLQMWSGFLNDSNGVIIKTGPQDVGFRNGFGNSIKNYGHIDIQEGLLWFQNANMLSGSVSISSTGDFNLSGNNNITVSDLTVTGPGTMRLNGNTTTFNGDNIIEKLRLEGGNISGTGDVTITDSLICVASTSANISIITIEPQAVLVLDKPLSVSLDTIYLKGQTIYSVDGELGGGSNTNIINSGTMDILINDELNVHALAFSQFVNESAGVVNINIPTGYSVQFSPSSFTNYGDINLQSGRIQFNTFGNFYAGKCVFSENTVVDFINGNIRWNDGSEIYGSGTIKSANADIEFFGKVLPGGNDAGLLTVNTATNRKLKLTSTSHLLFQLEGKTAGVEYDQMVVSNTIEIDGRLEILLGNSFAPALGDTFAIILHNGFNGVFADTLLPVLPDPGLGLEVIYTDSVVRLAVIDTPTGLDETEDEGNIPTQFALYQNHPNPFNPSTTIRFELPVNAQVDLRVYNSLGQEAEVLINNEELSSGVFKYSFNASHLSSGVYFYRIITKDFVETKKMVLLR